MGVAEVTWLLYKASMRSSICDARCSRSARAASGRKIVGPGRPNSRPTRKKPARVIDWVDGGHNYFCMDTRRLMDTKQKTMKWQIAFIVVLILATPLSVSAGHTKGRAVQQLTSEFKTGEYVWHPEISPAGPVVIIVSLPGQRMYVYRNGVRIGVSTVSTGTKRHATPTGIFTILQKKVTHESNIYKGAQMPHMQRLTWTGIAMHAGHLPGYPASHGCVRLPVDFAAKLYSVTSNGTSVIITDDQFAPGETAEPGRLLSGKTGAPSTSALAKGKFEWHPEDSPTGPVSIILSTLDQQAYVYRNGIEIGRAAVSTTGLGQGLGSHVYSALDKFASNGQREWLSTASFGRTLAPDVKEVVNRVTIAPGFLEHARAAISPGTTLVITDLPVSSQTRSGPGFNILTTD
jgi:hypothetical protein